MSGVRVVESPDEVSYHMIDAAHAALRLQTQTTPTEKADLVTPAAKRSSTNEAQVPSPEKMAVDTPEVSAAAVAPAVAPVVTKALTGADLRAAVLRTLRDTGDDIEGLTVDALASKVTPASAADVRKVLDELVGDGEVYTTIDDDHFAAV